MPTKKLQPGGSVKKRVVRVSYPKDKNMSPADSSAFRSGAGMFQPGDGYTGISSNPYFEKGKQAFTTAKSKMKKMGGTIKKAQMGTKLTKPLKGEPSVKDMYQNSKPAPKPAPKSMVGIRKAKSGGSFPDLNKDGKVTKADILKGRGVIAKKGAAVKKCKYGCK